MITYGGFWPEGRRGFLIGLLRHAAVDARMAAVGRLLSLTIESVRVWAVRCRNGLACRCGTRRKESCGTMADLTGEQLMAEIMPGRWHGPGNHVPHVPLLKGVTCASRSGDVLLGLRRASNIPLNPPSEGGLKMVNILVVY